MAHGVRLTLENARRRRWPGRALRQARRQHGRSRLRDQAHGSIPGRREGGHPRCRLRSYSHQAYDIVPDQWQLDASSGCADLRRPQRAAARRRRRFGRPAASVIFPTSSTSDLSGRQHNRHRLLVSRSLPPAAAHRLPATDIVFPPLQGPRPGRGKPSRPADLVVDQRGEPLGKHPADSQTCSHRADKAADQSIAQVSLRRNQE